MFKFQTSVIFLWLLECEGHVFVYKFCVVIPRLYHHLDTWILVLISWDLIVFVLGRYGVFFSPFHGVCVCSGAISIWFYFTDYGSCISVVSSSSWVGSYCILIWSYDICHYNIAKKNSTIVSVTASFSLFWILLWQIWVLCLFSISVISTVMRWYDWQWTSKTIVKLVFERGENKGRGQIRIGFDKINITQTN